MNESNARRRQPRLERMNAAQPFSSPFELLEVEARTQSEHFGVARDQIEHDFVISHVLAALAPHAGLFVFYGGTALSRTILDGLRLSEDLDLLSVGRRASVAATLDEAIRSGLRRGFGEVTASPWLSDAPTDTTACIFRIGPAQLKVQLIDSQNYAAWPRQKTRVSQRYSGLPDVELTTYTAQGFAAAKLIAWCDTTRNAPRDLYDLWALGQEGHINAAAALAYKRHGPTNSFPRAWMFPLDPPSADQWTDALGHQCIPKVGPAEAFAAVVSAWESASASAESGGAL